MLKIKVSDLLGKHKMSQKELAQKANIQQNSVSALYHETVLRIDVRHLDSICNVFDCKIEDVLEHVPDSKTKK